MFNGRGFQVAQKTDPPTHVYLYFVHFMSNNKTFLLKTHVNKTILLLVKMNLKRMLILIRCSRYLPWSMTVLTFKPYLL